MANCIDVFVVYFDVILQLSRDIQTLSNAPHFKEES